jgi:hypothetical protein
VEKDTLNRNNWLLSGFGDEDIMTGKRSLTIEMSRLRQPLMIIWYLRRFPSDAPSDNSDRHLLPVANCHQNRVDGKEWWIVSHSYKFYDIRAGRTLLDGEFTYQEFRRQCEGRYKIRKSEDNIYCSKFGTRL